MRQIFSKIPTVIKRTVIFTPLLLVLLLVLAIGVDFTFYKINSRLPIAGFVLHELPFRGKPFSKEAWDDVPFGNGNDTSCFRGAMVRSLLQEHLIVGEINRSSVETLLGQSTYAVQTGNDVCAGYYLGFCSGFALDADSLFTCFDNEGSLTQVGTVQH